MIERQLDQPEAWGCEYCNPDGVDAETEIDVCQNKNVDSSYFDRSNTPILCTRPMGHADEHAHCTMKHHPFYVWDNVK